LDRRVVRSGPGGRRDWVAPALLAWALAAPGAIQAQSSLHPLVNGLLVTTGTDLTPGNGRLAEISLVQPMLGLHGTAAGGHLGFTATVDFEGLSTPNGELTLGGWGEGFIDRRHPHTYAHELVVAGLVGKRPGAGAWQLGIVGGKGFVPFGTDDPMSRPPLRYPVNHHWSQILERAMLAAQLRLYAAVLEASLFNGDEPEYPSQWPNWSRFGDSWAIRLLLEPAPWLELQGSLAKVHSPEHRPGAGLDQDKVSVSGRFDRPTATGNAYAMVEWAQTREADGFFRYQSWLAEGAIRTGRHRPYVRYERTERPEEERTVDPFRSLRPHLENSILGTSRWTIYTAGYRIAVTGPGSGAVVEAFAETSRGRIAKIGGGVFEVDSYYGEDAFWSLSVGIRIGIGLTGHRMGRYGVLASLAPSQHGLHQTEPRRGP
jgi:hypothetical protein